MRASTLTAALGITLLFAAGCGDDGRAAIGPDGRAVVADQATTPTAGDGNGSGDSAGLSGSDAILIARWSITDYRSSGGSFLASVSGSDPWIEFFADGTMTGWSGCADLTGTFIISGAYQESGVTATTDDDGQHLATGNFEADTSSCSGELVAQHDNLIAAVDASDRWVFLDPTFILKDSQRQNLVVATAA